MIDATLIEGITVIVAAIAGGLGTVGGQKVLAKRRKKSREEPQFSETYQNIEKRFGKTEAVFEERMSRMEKLFDGRMILTEKLFDERMLNSEKLFSERLIRIQELMAERNTNIRESLLRIESDLVKVRDVVLQGVSH